MASHPAERASTGAGTESGASRKGGKTTDDKAIVGITTLDTDIYKYVVTGVGSNVALYNLMEDLAEGTNLCSPSCDATEEDIIDELVECSDQFRDTSCQDADKNESCGPSTPCCPGLFCSSQSGTCVDPI